MSNSLKTTETIYQILPDSIFTFDLESEASNILVEGAKNGSVKLARVQIEYKPKKGFSGIEKLECIYTINEKQITNNIVIKVGYAFKAKSHILSLLGDELIGSDNLAIFELVKNAYDADAEEVKITLNDLNTPKQSIVVEDDGNGMALEVLQNVWLEIGTDFKRGLKRKPSPKYKRISLGEKGVGRLAVHKLGKKIVLETQAKGNPNSYRISFNALGRYPEAKRCLEESVNACHFIGNMQGEIAQLQALGNVYRNLGEFDSAIKVYNRAVMLAEKEELFGLSSSLGNLASIYTHLEQPDEALKCLEKGLKIALQIGNKQSEGSMLCSIGIAHFQKGDYEKGIQFIQDSIHTTRLIGDWQGECMALLNLSNINLQVEEFDKCIENAIASLQIAETFGLRQSEAGAIYNIGSAYYFKRESKTSIPYLKKAIKIFLEIYGNDHLHTQAAIKGLIRAEKFPEYNQMTKMNLI